MRHGAKSALGVHYIRGRLVLLGAALSLSLLTAPALAQQIIQEDGGPVVIGRDPAELGEVIGKEFLLKIWLTDVGGPGFQSIRAVRVDPSGNITLPGIAPVHAEGQSIAAVEAQITALYKPTVPTVKVWVSILDKKPPPPPPPPKPPAPAKPATAPSTKPAPAKMQATSAPAKASTTAPAKLPAATTPLKAPATAASTRSSTTAPVGAASAPSSRPSH